MIERVGTSASVAGLLVAILSVTVDRQIRDAVYPEPLLVLMAVVAGVMTGLWWRERRRPAPVGTGEPDQRTHPVEHANSVTGEPDQRTNLVEDANSVTGEPDHRTNLVADANSVTVRWLESCIYDFADHVDSAFVVVPSDPLRAIERVLRHAWEAIDGPHQHLTADSRGRLEFRVTFMTLSYADGEITVAAWANRAYQRPHSLLKRATDPRTYDESVTADIYKMPEPVAVITPDTRQRRAHPGQFHIYAEEPNIILSHMAWPVLSPNSELLGTFVVDCNRRGFFQDDDWPLWQAFSEPFVKIISLEKLRLDRALSRQGAGYEGPGPDGWQTPPF